MPVWKPSSRPDFAGPALLDTHVWVWMLEGDLRLLSRATGPRPERCAADAGLIVCDISFWEVGVRASKGKLTLSVDTAMWLRRAERAPGVGFLPLDRDILVLSTRLPGPAHGDPADRMLLAASQLHGLPLVTADQRIIAYGRSQRAVSVCDVRRSLSPGRRGLRAAEVSGPAGIAASPVGAVQSMRLVLRRQARPPALDRWPGSYKYSLRCINFPRPRLRRPGQQLHPPPQSAGTNTA